MMEKKQVVHVAPSSQADHRIHPLHKIDYLQQRRHDADIVFDGAACDRLWTKKNEPFSRTEWRSPGHVLLEPPNDGLALPWQSWRRFI